MIQLRIWSGFLNNNVPDTYTYYSGLKLGISSYYDYQCNEIKSVCTTQNTQTWTNSENFVFQIGPTRNRTWKLQI